MIRKHVAILGCGKLGRIIAKAKVDGLLDDYIISAVYSRTRSKAEELAAMINGAGQGHDCRVVGNIAELIGSKPHFIAETASIAAMKEIAVPALQQGISLITISIGAFADSQFYADVVEASRQGGGRVHIASGAIGGLDVLRTVALMGQPSSVSFRTEKGPNSLKGTAVYDESLQMERKEVFAGSAKEAIVMFPTKVNVSVAASIASVGVDRTKVSINSIPCFIGDDHRIEINNNDVRAIIDVYSANADIAGWSVVNVLRNIASPIVF
jgi:aspartate dehydrogenase